MVVAELERRTTSGRAGDDRRVNETLPDWEVAEAPKVGDVAQAIKSAVLAHHRVDVAHIVLIKPGSVPKTSSGKIQRHECRRQFLEGELDEFGRLSRDQEAPSMTIPTEAPQLGLDELSSTDHQSRVDLLTEYLADLAAYIIGCGVEPLLDTPLMSAGLDSLKAMELQYAIEERLGVRLFPSLLLGGATVRDVAQELADADFDAAFEGLGLADASSEVFTEPTEGRLTETIRFDVGQKFEGEPRLREAADDRLSFSEDPNPWGPTPTIEFRLEGEPGTDLSWNEKGFWLYQKAFPESWAPNLYYAGELPEGTTRDQVTDVATRILSRHANLRSRYLTVEGEPVREFADPGPVPVERIDATGWTREQLVEAFQAQASRPFDLAAGPIIRFAYFERTDERPVIYVSMHHIVADFWSLEHLIREIGQEVSGEEIEDPAIQYGEFVHWQQSLINSSRGKWCEEFWREQLASGIPGLQFPVTASPSPSPGYGRPYRAHMDRELLDAVDSFSAERRATRYTVLLAAYQTLLHRWTGQSEFLVGAVAAGRTRRFFQDVLGMFANPLPLRSRLSPDVTFAEHLTTTQQNLLEAMDAQEYPLQTMLERFDLPRTSGGNPIVQTLFASEQPREGSLEIGASVGGLETVDIGLAGTVFDFTVMVYQGVDGGEIRLHYNDSKYDEATVARLAESYREILAEVVNRPDTPVGALPIVADETRGRLTTEWGRGEELDTGGLAVHRMFEERAKADPDRPAVVSEDGTWTYEELNRRANRIAHCLIEQGVRPGTRVGVEVERSPELIAALFGVLKAGGTYVALQPTLPEKRLQYMVDDSGVRITVTDDPDRHAMGGERIAIDVMDDDSIAADDPGVAVEPEGLAYVLYTSGTTGLPKGVMLPHRAVTNLVGVIARQYPVDGDDVILQKTPYSFDISVSEIFNPLASGASLVMTRPDAARDPAYLRELILEHGVTVLRMTPTELASLLSTPDVTDCGSVVRRVLSCGEALTPAVCEAFYAEWPEVELINIWGPTEACVYASFWQCRPDHLDTVPIGRPLPNYRLYCLDDGLDVVPVGLQGELFVGGPSLARGYHGLPRKTALTYLPDPDAEQAGARMYKSGDLVSWDADGELGFFGRKDSQVQLRGMRIELGELEAILERHPDVKMAAVRAIESDDGRVESLAAYVVLTSEAAVSAGDLRAHLAEHVEESKIPGQFMELPEMPLTPSGKVNRKKLPEPDGSLRTSDRVAPSSPAERRIASLWRKHLEVDDIGVNENFFEIGGHSLLAVRIQHDIMRTLGLEVPLGMLFDEPTIAGLAARLQQEEGLEFAPVEHHDYGDEAPLSAGQRLMWIQQYLEGDTATYHSPGVFRLIGNLDVGALNRALDRLVERHEILRTIYPLQGDEPVQKILPAEPLPLPVIDVRDADDPEGSARSRVADHVAEPFDLTEETSFRPLLARVRDREWVLCLLFHHIAFDEWSVDILFTEIEALYRQERGDEGDDAEAARLEDWRETYQVAYRNLSAQLEAGEIEDPTFNTDGWLSSYTGEKYADEAMEEWLQSTLERLRGLDLGRTLEIGCGTGMVLFELASQASEYVGVDFSESALAYVDAVRDQLDRDLSHVELVHGRADELAQVTGEFDTVIINSVAQYFPNHAYLEDVIRAASARLKRGGRIYLGDLRDGRTGFAFHASVTMRRASSETPRETVREWATQRLLQDDELLISPDYLSRVAQGLPEISHVDFSYPRAEHATEMSLFRYGATLHARSEEEYSVPETVLHWTRADLSSDEIKAHLENTDGTLLVTGIPNRRQEEFARLQRWLHEAGDDTPYSTFEAMSPRDAVEPDLIRELGESAGFRVTVSPSNDSLGFRFDALFERDTGDLSDVRPLTPLTAQATALPVPSAPSDGDEEIEHASLLWKRLTAAVREYSRGDHAAEDIAYLPDPVLQYADFAIWENEQFQTGDFREGIRFWKEHLAGARADVDWPIGSSGERRRPAGYVQHACSEEGSEAIAAYASDRGTSEFVVLHAAFSAFLAQFCRQEDLTIGVGTTLRQRPEFREMIGYMLNMLPLRTNLSLDATFEEWFAHSRSVWASSQPHQWVPVERITEAMGGERGSGSLSLYDVMMAYVPRNHLRRSSAVTNDFDREFAGVRIQPFDYGGVPEALCSLFVSLFKDDDGFGMELEYDAGRFERWQMEKLAQQFQWAIERMLSEPKKPLSETVDVQVGDAPDAEIGEWTRGPRFEANEEPIHQMFEAWAARDPERTALTFDGGTMSYGELDSRANRLARRLADRGVRAGAKVGVTVRRSPELVVALLGVMKTGAAYVSMEPDLPRERLRHIAGDSGAGFVVVDSVGHDVLGDDDRWETIDVSAAAEEELSDEPLEVDVDPDDLVYVLYTSGTTGNPKGVMVPHRSVANHVGWLAEAYGCDENDVFLLKSAYGFDMSVSELYGPLCLGGTMAIARPGGQRDPSYLVNAVRDFEVTCLRVVPTTLNLLLTESACKTMGDTLRWVSLGGEALSVDVRDRFFDTFEDVELHNPYGITETTVDVSFWECPRERRGEPVSLGRPMGNYDAYTLDRLLAPVPQNRVGEIFVGGAGVTHGYWGMPSRTALAFLPNPYAEEPGARMYASGDLGRWDERGELQYQGRKDNQIQLNGIRIELGEVEAMLSAAPGVQQGAVRTVNEREGRAEGFVAYVVPAEGETPDVPEIRAYLEQHLRKAVIPTRFVVLDEMPRRPSGKIDRDALPEPDQRVGGEQARSDTEEKVSRIWSEVLGVEEIGRDANFFEVGGTSLKAIKVFRRLKDEFEIDFEVVELFAYPTIGKLAAFLDGDEQADRKADLEKQRKRGERRRRTAKLAALRRAKKDR